MEILFFLAEYLISKSALHRCNIVLTKCPQSWLDIYFHRNDTVPYKAYDYCLRLLSNISLKGLSQSRALKKGLTMTIYSRSMEKGVKFLPFRLY